jgi:hypothetical protein
MTTLAALAPLPPDYARLTYQEQDDVNPLQRLIADAMEAAGMPLERRGSKAELSRRAGVEDAIISNIFNRPRYVPEDDVRAKLSNALGIPRSALDAAAAEIKGLRIYSTSEQPDASRGMRLLDEAHADLALSAADLSPDDLAEIRAKLDAIAAQVTKRHKGDRDE